MWQKDPAYWAKTSPVLFPYIGAVPETVTIHGIEYAIPRHGFVKDVEFDVEDVFIEKKMIPWYVMQQESAKKKGNAKKEIRVTA